jgi:L-alanine-DL-glutamate epimerase-like enolase superfamily enzyme
MTSGIIDPVPSVTEIVDRMHVVALPMRVKFRGITVRELALIDGPAGWGEFGAFPEYQPPEAAAWLAAAVEATDRRRRRTATGFRSTRRSRPSPPPGYPKFWRGSPAPAPPR